MFLGIKNTRLLFLGIKSCRLIFLRVRRSQCFTFVINIRTVFPNIFLSLGPIL